MGHSSFPFSYFNPFSRPLLGSLSVSRPQLAWFLAHHQKEQGYEMKIITILSHITFLLQNMLWNGTNTISPLLYATFLCWYLLLLLLIHMQMYVRMYVVMCECIMLFVCLHLGQMCECMSNFKCCYKNTCLYE